MKKYRITKKIVAGRCGEYFVQCKYFLFPFWVTVGHSHYSLEDAENFAIRHSKNFVVKELGRL